MPNSGQLPENLKPLARRNAVPVNHYSFHDDVNRLIEQLDLALKTAENSRSLKAKDEIHQVSQTTVQAVDTVGLRSDAEYNFLAQTVMQANKDQTRVSTIYSVAVFILMIAVGWFGQLLDPEIITQAIKLIVSGLFMLSALSGTSTIINLGQLRKTWKESILAMNQFRGLNGSSTNTLKKNNSDNQAIEVAMISGLAFGIAIFFLLQAFFLITILTWIICVLFGSQATYIQMIIFKR